jgi:hypothetical protein
VYCRYRVEFLTPRWQVLRPADESRCGEPEGPIDVLVDAGEPAAVPHRPGMMTIVTVAPQFSLADRLRSLVFKPRTLHVEYGPGRWRYAHGDVANRLMLNAPRPHPSYPTQPVTPYDPLSIDSPARLTFEFIPVAPLTAPPQIGVVSIADLVVREARPWAELSRAPALLHSHDIVVAQPEGSCLVGTPTGGIDPWLEFSVPDGSGLYVDSSTGGMTTAFVRIEKSKAPGRRYPGDQPLVFALASEPVEVFMPVPSEQGSWDIRIDPPAAGAVHVCLFDVDA